MAERTAKQAYEEHVLSVVSQVKSLTEWAQKLIDIPEDVHWGNVGDITEVDTQLKQALDFIKSIPN